MFFSNKFRLRGTGGFTGDPNCHPGAETTRGALGRRQHGGGTVRSTHDTRREESNETRMTPAKLRKTCLSLPGATEQIQWGKDRVFKVGGKMFACSGIERSSRYSFKVDDHRFLELTDLPGIVPAPYLARAKWVQVDPAACTLRDADLDALVRHSYELVFAKLTRKLQREISSA